MIEFEMTKTRLAFKFTHLTFQIDFKFQIVNFKFLI